VVHRADESQGQSLGVRSGEIRSDDLLPARRVSQGQEPRAVHVVWGNRRARSEDVSGCRARIERGVLCRTIYEGVGLSEEWHRRLVREGVRIGEEVRVLIRVPVKIAIADRRQALVPLQLDEPGAGALVVHQSPLLDALCALFDTLWSRAAPLRRTVHVVEGDQEAGGLALSESDREILFLLSAGLKDEAIARSLRVSRRTVQRRVSEVMDRLGARTRFQAGMQAVVQGWVHQQEPAEAPERPASLPVA
jgi:DNA-binding CsgD family transcriptional regulator